MSSAMIGLFFYFIKDKTELPLELTDSEMTHIRSKVIKTVTNRLVEIALKEGFGKQPIGSKVTGKKSHVGGREHQTDSRNGFWKGFSTYFELSARKRGRETAETIESYQIGTE